MPQRKIVATRILVFDFELSVDELIANPKTRSGFQQ